MSATDPLTGEGCVAAIDLGGTKILAAIFGPDGAVMSRAKVMTRAKRGPDAVVEAMADAVRDAAAEAGIEPEQIVGIGVGAPGPMDPEAGIVKEAPNLGWFQYPLAPALRAELDRPVFLGNDVTLAVFAEHLAGAGRGVRHLVGIWPGTGVGGGIVVNGELYGGAGHLAGEIGHMTVKAGGPKCGCGGRGHLEALCSRTAIVKEIARQVKRGKSTDLEKLAGGDVLDATSGDIAKALRRDDKLVKRVVDRAARYLALGIAGAVNLLNPEVVVLGGGVVEALGEPFVERVGAYVRKEPLQASTAEVRVVKSALGDDAGIVGAALLVRRGLA